MALGETLFSAIRRLRPSSACIYYAGRYLVVRMEKPEETGKDSEVKGRQTTDEAPAEDKPDKKKAPAAGSATAKKAGGGTKVSSGLSGGATKKVKSPPRKEREGGYMPAVKRFFSSGNAGIIISPLPLPTEHTISNMAGPHAVDYSKMSITEKRKHYTCGRDYVTLSDIQTWAEFHKGIYVNHITPEL